MEVTKQDIAKTLRVLRANAKSVGRGTTLSKLVEKTGFTASKLTAIRKELLSEGLIREQRGPGGTMEVFLGEWINLPQVLDFVVKHRSASASEIAEQIKVPEPEVQEICLELIRRGMFVVTSISVKRSAMMEFIAD